jgi:hypothetical protein
MDKFFPRIAYMGEGAAYVAYRTIGKMTYLNVFIKTNSLRESVQTFTVRLPGQQG